MLPWQHIFESVLMQNQPIQLSNDVTVTLFLNQSSQNYELSLEMIISTFVQNFSRIQCFILPWQHIRLRVLLTNRVLKISDDIIVTSFLIQSHKKFCIFVCYAKRHLCAKFEQNRTRNKEVEKKGNDAIVMSFLKITQQFFVCEYFLLIPIDVPSFKLIKGQIKELQGVVPNTPLRLRMTKKGRPRQDRVNG